MARAVVAGAPDDLPSVERFASLAGLGVGGLTYAADTCGLIEDAGLAVPIYEQLLVFEGQNTVVGSAVVCYGAADRMLGALATVMERWDDAERHLENALVLNQRLDSPTWIAHWRR